MDVNAAVYAKLAFLFISWNLTGIKCGLAFGA